jgi:glycosyltransferase involved in cell wall biosynthesis
VKLEIAIILATYNGELYIKEQIDSIINQTYKKWILFISDDCSNDDTLRIIREYEGKYPEKIKIINMNKKFGNASDNFLFLLKNAFADLYFFCDQDDIWHEEKIEKFISLYQSLDEQVRCKSVLMHSDLTIIKNKKKIIHKSIKDYSYLFQKAINPYIYLVMNNITGCSMCINDICKRMLFDHCDNNILKNIVMHDWFLGLIASFFGNIFFIDESLVLYRQHTDNVLGASTYISLKRFLRKNNEKRIFNQNLSFFLAYANILSNDHQRFLYDYFFVQGKNKFNKYLFYKKNRLMKNGLLRKIVQILRL